ncbi:MAG: hypothetical protein WBL62_06820 [Gallionella sp.]
MSTALKKLASSNIAAHNAVALSEGLHDFGIETDLTAEELFETGIRAFSTSLFMAVKGGMAFMAAQEGLRLRLSESGEGETFAAWIKQNKLTEQRVYEVIKIAKGYLAIPAEQRRSYLALGKYKALKLASIEPEALAELAEKSPDAIGELALMSRADMAKQMVNLRAQLETEQARSKRLLEASNKPRLTQFLDRTEAVRGECIALQTEAELPINALQMLFEEVNAEDSMQAEWHLQMEQLWVAAHIVAARAVSMIERMNAVVRVDDMPTRITGTHLLTPAEAERWLLDAPMIVNRHEAEKALRQTKRDEAQPKGRGRPAGSRNKGAAE